MYIVELRHNCSADPHVNGQRTMEEVSKAVLNFAEGYDFEIHHGKLFDWGNSNLNWPSPPTENDLDDGGFTCFSWVDYEDGLIVGFSHCDGDGPQATYRKIENF